MKSQLLTFYKFSRELACDGLEPVDIEIGLSEKLFKQLQYENVALLTKFEFKSSEEFESIKEFNFNTGTGSLLIYNKDKR